MTTAKHITHVSLSELENSAHKIIEDVRAKNKATHFSIACRLELDLQEISLALRKNYGRHCLFASAQNAYHTTEAMFLIGLSSRDASIYNREELTKVNIALKYLCDLHNPSSTFLEA